MAIVLSIIAILHLIFLHQPGSSGPLVYSSEKIKFFSYFYLKDVFVLILVVLAYFVITVYFPNLLGHHYNYIRANPLVTPTHIVPEWYFLPFYTILRSFDNKLVGVIAMILSILLLLTLPYVESGLLSKSYLPAILDKFTFYFLMFSVFGL
jgi:ubiquinol-cytochrome c reductase cytochrome b subunit